MKSIPRWAQILIGVAIVMVFLAIGAVIVGVSWVREHVDIATSSETDAVRAFDDIHAKFPGQQPLLELRNGRPHYIEDRASQDAPRSALTTMHVLAWDADEEHLAKVDVPWWLLRWKSGTISFGSYASGIDDAGVKLRPEDIERHGRGILLDFTQPREGRVLVWVE